MKRGGRSVSLTEDQILQYIKDGLENLRRLCCVYDEGHSYIAFFTATEVERILSSNRVAVQLRGTKTFATVEDASDERSVMIEHKLIYVRLGGSPPAVEFMPNFKGGCKEEVKGIPFRVWWGRDVIFRASAAQLGWPPAGYQLIGPSMFPTPKLRSLSAVNLLR